MMMTTTTTSLNSCSRCRGTEAPKTLLLEALVPQCLKHEEERWWWLREVATIVVDKDHHG
jgi:hypothetical protein